MEIVLGRHGRPALSRSKWIAPRTLGYWLASFNGSGILGDRIPQATLLAATGCKVIVASPLRRSYQSALLLASSQLIVTQDSVSEAGMPHQDWLFPARHSPFATDVLSQ
jgi:hypothetical protein